MSFFREAASELGATLLRKLKLASLAHFKTLPSTSGERKGLEELGIESVVLFEALPMWQLTSLRKLYLGRSLYLGSSLRELKTLLSTFWALSGLQELTFAYSNDVNSPFEQMTQYTNEQLPIQMSS
jgi:hypothetical protein